MPVTSPHVRAERLYYNQRGCNELTRSLNIHEVARLTRQRRHIGLLLRHVGGQTGDFRLILRPHGLAAC